MKKVLCLLISVCCIFSSMVAFAAEDTLNTLDNNVFNLVTSFIGDVSESRGFAWTAADGFDNMVLSYKKADDTRYTSVNPTVVDKGDYLYYKADLNNLVPSTEYIYKIGDTVDDIWYGPFKFTTAASNITKFSFVGVSDPQGSAQTDYNYYKTNINTALADVDDAAFVVNLGDLVNNGYNEDQWKWHFDAISEHCTDIPYMGVVGNHDVLDVSQKAPELAELWTAGENFKLHLNQPSNGSDYIKNKLSSSDMTNRWFREIVENLDDTVYSFDYGNAHFSVINTAAEVSLGGTYGNDCRKLMQAESEWLDADLKASNKKWKIVLMHMGGYRADTWRTDVASIEYFGNVIDDNCVDLVLQGHDHIYMRTYPITGGNLGVGTNEVDTAFMGTTYTVLGGAANKRYALTSLKGPGDHVYVYKNTAQDQPVYCTFNVSDSAINVVAKQTDGTVLDEYSVVKSDLSNFKKAEVSADTDNVTVKGVLQAPSAITVLVTYPNVDEITSFEDICYINEIQTNGNGAYYFMFGDRKKSIGKYNIVMNISGVASEYDYEYKPKMYLSSGTEQIDKLKDISDNDLRANLEIINTDNGRLYCAQYKGDMLKDVSVVNVSKGVNGGMTIQYLGDSEVDKIKLFFWDQTTNTPIIKPVIIY